tara:strand:- start:84 stop:317 length:234 start_codon:yes stop_codon:yes gene_type:complete
MYEDDPRAEAYDKYGRYYPKETMIQSVTSLATFDSSGDVMKRGDYNLFHRGNREAQLQQLEDMKYKSNFHEVKPTRK